MRPAGRQHSVTIPITPVRTSSDSLRTASRCPLAPAPFISAMQLPADAAIGSHPVARGLRTTHAADSITAPNANGISPSPFASGSSRASAAESAIWRFASAARRSCSKAAARRSTRSSSPSTRRSACSKTSSSKTRSS